MAERNEAGSSNTRDSNQPLPSLSASNLGCLPSSRQEPYDSKLLSANTLCDVGLRIRATWIGRRVLHFNFKQGRIWTPDVCNVGNTSEFSFLKICEEIDNIKHRSLVYKSKKS
ncbi:hypothetical protein L2E82_25944 [Cichorium intybus]|uniref:Uncharacterized protein n=1 Tax=Cichorium intybus TaxID=13427 RepID=A0ACB9E5B6_CICIN|nr:hypothetical protein L2E82_25944 [Cichorium intybus]